MHCKKIISNHAVLTMQSDFKVVFRIKIRFKIPLVFYIVHKNWRKGGCIYSCSSSYYLLFWRIFQRRAKLKMIATVCIADKSRYWRHLSFNICAWHTSEELQSTIQKGQNDDENCHATSNPFHGFGVQMKDVINCNGKSFWTVV